MTKSIVALAVIVFLAAGGVVCGYIYTKTTAEAYLAPLEEAYKSPNAEKLAELSERWGKDKKTLMLIINHRDIEAVSTALIRACEEAASSRFDMAAEEVSVAKFLITELVAREKLSFENIF